MAVGIPVAEADSYLGKFDTAFVQLHSGDPGAAGTANVSTAAAARKSIGFGAEATVGTVRQRANGAIVRWDAADVTGTETITHWSVWSASSAGTFYQSGQLDAPMDLEAGVPAEIQAGAIKANIGPLAAA